MSHFLGGSFPLFFSPSRCPPRHFSCSSLHPLFHFFLSLSLSLSAPCFSDAVSLTLSTLLVHSSSSFPFLHALHFSLSTTLSHPPTLSLSLSFYLSLSLSL